FAFGFFFSSRRRHTRFSRDWSSDVCSSDLTGSHSYAPHAPDGLVVDLGDLAVAGERGLCSGSYRSPADDLAILVGENPDRAFGDQLSDLFPARRTDQAPVLLRAEPVAQAPADVGVGTLLR